MVRKASHALFSLFFPQDCRICGHALYAITRIPVCPRCLAEPVPLSAEFFCVSCRTPFLNRFPLDEEGRCALCRLGLRGFDAAYCFGSYEGVLRELIHLYKYGRIKTLARPLGELLAAALPRDERFDAVTPVPLHWRRQWRRGVNQAELLARSIAGRHRIPMLPVLRRVHSTKVQAGLSNAGRRGNVSAAFAARGGIRGGVLGGLWGGDRGWGHAGGVRDKRILLVDDVMTTGSTAAACALALKRAGASRVALLTVARVDRRFDGTRAAAAHPDVEVPF